MKRLRVLVVEDSLTVRKYLVECLRADPDIDVIAEAEDGKQGIELCERLRPDVVTLDMMMPVMTGLSATERATAQDPEAAVLMGVNIDTIVRLTFLLGGAMAGVAGVLYAMEFENIRFNIGFILGIKAFTAAVLGGIGNIRGALLGGVALGLVENWGAIFFGSQWKDVIAFVILVVVLMFRPTGILGESLQKARA